MASFKQGDRGPGVLLAQGILNKLHYDVTKIDGLFGQETRAAVIAFQQSMGLKADGVVGDETANSMVSEIWALGPKFEGDEGSSHGV